ncbi:MAG: ABC transporter permease [Acidimicrobiia bacterium]|nr:ABC transporter permease [Acidimicrobiia bacterium]MDH4306249.1 ABC transporter permease [Acidimicrobiia bacterium]MDH5294959.1 ABC transporter permease [Acidimicrobiia bacterium]
MTDTRHVSAIDDSIETEARSFGRQVWDRFRRHKLAVLAAVVLVVLTVSFWVAPALSPYEFDEITPDFRQPPTAAHPFGTDDIGRDLLVRTFMGGRFSIRIALLVALSTTLIGTLLGAVAGYFGGWIDALVSQIINMVLLVPALAILLVLALKWGSSPWSISIVLAALLWTRIARVVRGLFLQYKEQEFVMAARSAGARSGRIMFRHILPNVMGPVVVETTLLVGTAIILESTLSFLGLGVQFPTPTLGNLVAEAKGAIDSNPYRVLLPGSFVMLITLSINFLGDGLRDALDPSSGGGRT